MSYVEFIKKFYDAFKNKDVKTCLELCHDQIEWQTAEGMPNGGKFIGKKEVFENYFPKMLENFKEFHAVPEQFTDMKDHVTVNGRSQGIVKKVSYDDGKTWISIPEVRNIRIVD
jgi:ketosteroid isomerase-like protein